MNNSVSDYRLERLLLGELPTAERDELLRDPAIVEKLEKMKDDNERILARYPFRPETLPLPEKKKPFLKGGLFERAASFFSKPRILVPALSFSALVFAAALILPGVFLTQPGPDEDYRIKGEMSHLYLYKKSASEAYELANGAVVHSGDTIQVAYSSPLPLFGYIFSLDGNGQITSHLPEKGNLAARLRNEKLQLLDYSYILDDAPQYEVFFLVTSRNQFDVDEIKTLAAGLRTEQDITKALASRLKNDFRATSIKLIKE